MSWTLHVPRGWTGEINATTFAAITPAKVLEVMPTDDGGLDVTFDTALDAQTTRRVLLWARLADDQILSDELALMLQTADDLARRLKVLEDWQKTLAAVKVAGTTVLGVKST